MGLDENPRADRFGPRSGSDERFHLPSATQTDARLFHVVIVLLWLAILTDWFWGWSGGRGIWSALLGIAVFIVEMVHALKRHREHGLRSDTSTRQITR